jgi:uncharacterized protein (DUF302 family)
MQTSARGVVSKQSKYAVKETLDRLQKILQDRGVTIYARIDQQAEARKVGLDLSPVELLIFGNPKAGIPIMSAVPLSALDLPLKALSWQDTDNKVWISYNDAEYIGKRFSLPEGSVKNIDIGPLVELTLG